MIAILVIKLMLALALHKITLIGIMQLTVINGLISNSIMIQSIVSIEFFWVL